MTHRISITYANYTIFLFLSAMGYASQRSPNWSRRYSRSSSPSIRSATARKWSNSTSRSSRRSCSAWPAPMNRLATCARRSVCTSVPAPRTWPTTTLSITRSSCIWWIRTGSLLTTTDRTGIASRWRRRLWWTFWSSTSWTRRRGSRERQLCRFVIRPKTVKRTNKVV